MRPKLRALLAAVLAIAAVASTAAPADGFQNGHARPRDLTRIYIPGSNAAFLAKGSAAASFNTMRECAVRDGVDLYPHSSEFQPAATAYRNGAIQLILWNRFVSGHGAKAAPPIWTGHGWIFTSNHGVGRAVDIALPAQATWLLRHGPQFSWSHDEGARAGEWWHYRYLGGFRRPNPGLSLRFPNLRKGSGGKCQAYSVREVQRRLGLRQDGEYGPSTARAVRRFQRRHNLHVDGRVESRTWLKLRKIGRDLAAGRDPRTVANNLPGQTAPMSGVDVRAVQGLLNARFAELHRRRYRIRVTGVMDHATQVAVRRFQRLRHLKVTGRVDDRTYAVLLKRLAKPEPQLIVTPQGTKLVASFEGFRSCPYRDVVGVWTVGYGHTSGVSSATPCLSQAAGIRLLHRDLNQFALGATRLIKVHVSVRQFNAIVSWSYNVGLGAMAGSTLLRDLNQRHYAKAAVDLLAWNRAGGHVLLGLDRRRRAECRMYLRGSSPRTRRRAHC